MILRPSYIEAIAPFIDQPLVKILAGVRRCGKSTIFEMLADELRRRGVPEDRIIKKRYTEMDIPADISAKDMYDDLKLQIQGKGRCYLLLDEIQEVKGWEKTVNSLLEGADVDIYVTGSNSKLMSSEISTYLTGRYVSIPVYPLSFREFLDFHNFEVRETISALGGTHRQVFDKNGERYDVVDFYAFYELNGVLRQIGEKSFFDRKDDKLYYVDGVPLRGETYHRPEPKVGRNDPCPCGSGKKYKKCCGASA